MRADLLNNEKGIKINGQNLSFPNKHFVRKIDRQEIMEDNQRSIESLGSRDNDKTKLSIISPTSRDIKYDLRDQKHQSTMR
jgi:hypothetical protein